MNELSYTCGFAIIDFTCCSTLHITHTLNLVYECNYNTLKTDCNIFLKILLYVYQIEDEL